MKHEVSKNTAEMSASIVWALTALKTPPALPKSYMISFRKKTQAKSSGAFKKRAGQIASASFGFQENSYQMRGTLSLVWMLSVFYTLDSLRARSSR